jgi:hypothetical protein
MKRAVSVNGPEQAAISFVFYNHTSFQKTFIYLFIVVFESTDLPLCWALIKFMLAEPIHQHR